MRKLLFISILIVNICKGQTNDFSESFYFFPQNIFLLVPSYGGVNSDAQANLLYRSYFGQLTAIRAYAADVNFNVQKKSKVFPEQNKHIIGGGFYSEREGDFINRNRILLRYAWHTRLTETFNLSGGAAFHVINYLFRSSSAGSNGSDFAGSGNVSASVYSETFKLGLSINDFNEPTLKPIDNPSIVYRYYTGHLEKSLGISPKSRFIGSFRCNYIPKGYSTGILHLGIIFSEKVGINVLAHSSSGLGFSLDLNKIEIENSFLDVSFGYRVPYAKGARVPYNSYEINVGYYLVRQ
ncbi:MAG: type IX secretion system membrane protein PorP/SprF [Opitutaceae bacterium]|nr:type IX secretion system membrane protein PorP/SprF [Cytophagales bacterium]